MPANPAPLLQLLATLRALQGYAWTLHWKTAGPQFYGDHLLFERIYTGGGGAPVIDQIDGLGERLVGTFGPGVIDPEDVERRVLAVLQATRMPGDPIGTALAFEQKVQSLVASTVGQLPPTALVLDNYLRTIADQRSEVIYLLQQRLGKKA